MNALYTIIKVLQDAPTKDGGKKAVLDFHKNNALLKAYLKAVYDPLVNYYIKKLPKIVSHKPMATLDDEFLQWIASNIAGRKLTGKAAKEALVGCASCMDDEGIELLGYILGRDIRAGVGTSTILEFFPGLFYVPPYQRCASMTEERKQRFEEMGHFYVQTKCDGQFCYAINRPHTEQAMSRTGSLYPEWFAFHITAGMPVGYVAMGELLVEEEGKILDRKTGNGILNSVLSGEGSKWNPNKHQVRFLAWDMVTEDEFDAGFSDRDYELRWHDLCTKTQLERVPSWVVGSVKDANKIHKQHTARKEEGTVWKNPKMGWRNTTSGDKDMMKVKVVFEADYKITGAYEGEGKYAGMLGGFSLATSDGLIEFNCGSGFDDNQRQGFWRILQMAPKAFDGTIVTAEGNDIVTSKSKPGKEAVFLPIFVELRLDKKEADSRERVWEQFQAATGAEHD